MSDTKVVGKKINALHKAKGMTQMDIPNEAKDLDRKKSRFSVNNLVKQYE